MIENKYTLKELKKLELEWVDYYVGRRLDKKDFLGWLKEQESSENRIWYCSDVIHSDGDEPCEYCKPYRFKEEVDKTPCTYPICSKLATHYHKREHGDIVMLDKECDCGTRSECKECDARSSREYYAKNKDKSNAQTRAWQKTPKGREVRAATLKKMSEKYPEKMTARRKVKEALNSGKLVRPSLCADCRQPKKLEAHHPDYFKPLEVTWFCNQCHVDEHANV